MESLSLKSVIRQRKKIICRKIGTDFVLVPVNQTITDEDCLYSLNEVGSAIWALLDGKKNLGQIFKTIAKETDASEKQVVAEGLEFVQDLVCEKLVEQV